MSRRPIIVGNWKMNNNCGESLELARALRNALGGLSNIDVGIAPPYTALYAVAKHNEGSKLLLAAQNMHEAASGAYTGEISAEMLTDVGCSHVILGHSERRHVFGETDGRINAKVKAAIAASLKPILCLGETLEQREAGQTNQVVGAQLSAGLAGVAAEQLGGLVLAYEPVWAIGTGKVATTAQAQEVHAFLRQELRKAYGAALAEKVRIQYGGSVKPDNVSGLMAQPDIDGALVGGASLKADAFLGILKYNA
ncbi:MAG: triose-phosphate isomerase [Deltaproteobacteria bacterium]|nr:triose-phosphate isomerase [Deltaproteobacteria bacterium]